ncbi:PaaI family thioesterase [Microbacterium sp. RD1]|uniref:PaaI family thioesterase n=1 Tax=Microbacterium sp. RD1 TaxID=3457313 RepID=UPI003FA5E2CE
MTSRERTYTWEDPAALAAEGRRRSGIDLLTSIRSGELPPPPVAEMVGFDMVEVGDGTAVFSLEPAEYHYNPLGTVHGGVLSTLADTALGCAVHTRLPAGTGYTSLDLVVKFTRAATVDSGTLTCTGRVVTLGRRAATAEATIVDASARVVAHAVSTLMILRPDA